MTSKNLASSKQLLRFTAIGGVGFIIDASILTILFQFFELNLYISRMFSFGCASLATWLLNRTFTFAGLADNTRVKSAEYFRYITVQVIGSLLNLAIFTLLISTRPELRQWPVFPLAIGAAFALIFNFSATRYWVYSDRSDNFE
jgi:putative flippase GtrA